MRRPRASAAPRRLHGAVTQTGDRCDLLEFQLTAAYLSQRPRHTLTITICRIQSNTFIGVKSSLKRSYKADVKRS